MKKFTCFLAGSLFTTFLFSQPAIFSFTPASGAVGTTVTIKGTGFNMSPAANIVYFGAVKSTISGATDTTLTVSVPAGATYQPITVTTNNLTAYSMNSFTVTFAGPGGPFTPASFLPKTDLSPGIYPHGLSLADFNGDGKTDLVVSKGSSANISVFDNTSSNGVISFSSQLDLPAAGNNHESSATGDLDGDGMPDFVITNSLGTPSVSVYKNTSAGGNISFAPKIDYPADNAPYTVAIGDVDGDGRPDLVAANGGSNKISFYKNTTTAGTLSFDARVDFMCGTNPYSITINDLDGDGKPDLVITTQGSSSALSVMKNTTTGGVISFDSPIDYAILSGSFIVTVGDLDGDGKPDLAAASSSSNSVVVLRNTSTPGNLSFSPPQAFSTGNYPVCVSIGDLDGDGKPDLVTANRFSNDVSALKNISTAGSISFDTHVDYPSDTAPIYIAVGDLDGDGKPDILSANSSSTTVSIFRNIIGDNIVPSIGSFNPVSGISGTVVNIQGANFTGATSVSFGGAEAGSFTVDSATGITAIVGAGASGNVSVTTGNGTAVLPGFSFNGPIISSFAPAIGLPGTIVTISGVNFTGVTDVKFGGTPAASFTVNSTTSITATTGAGSSGSVAVVTANGTAALAGFTFGVPTIISVSPVSGPVGSTVLITGTNFNPVASANTVFFGAVKATVSSATSAELSVIVPAGATYKTVTVTTNNLTAYSSYPFFVTFPGDTTLLSAGSFAPVGDYGIGAYPFAVSISDLNNDGKPDVITANSVSNNISILKNSSTGAGISFDAKLDYNTGPDPKRIAIGDFDGDGKPDLVVTNFNAGNTSTISVFENNGTGGAISFAPRVDYNSGMGTFDVSIADMDGDGKPDMMTTSGNSGFFSFFKNTTVAAGSISFATKQDYSLFAHPDHITIADLDNDGRPDVIISNFAGPGISIFRNTSTGGVFSFANEIDYVSGTNPSYITTGDLDGDGKIDIIVSNYTSGTISLFRNYSTAGNISFAPKVDYTLASTDVSVADLNGDGKPDLFAGRGLSGIASVMENTFMGTGDFSFASPVDFTTGNYDTYVSVGDLDGDGKPELAVANTLANSVTILKNKIGEPVITSLSAPAASRGTAETISGRNLTGATSVTFGGSPAVSFAVISATKIEAVVGGGASGDITVTGPGGTGTIAGFKFIPGISKGGPVTFCDNGSVTLTSSATSNNQWYKNETAMSGATGNTVEVNTSGAYNVHVTSNGITTTSDTDVIVTVITVPAPVISKDGANLVSSASTGNQWYLDGNLIPGAVSQMYQPTEKGSYTVKNALDGCMSDFSAPFNFALTGLVDLGNGQFINLYPNPVKDQLTINWNINGMPLLDIQVRDLQGKQLLLNNNMHSGSSLDLSELPQGIYFIKIYNSQLKINNTIKIMKY